MITIQNTIWSLKLQKEVMSLWRLIFSLSTAAPWQVLLSIHTGHPTYCPEISFSSMWLKVNLLSLPWVSSSSCLFSLTSTNSINIPLVSKVRKFWEFYFFLFLAIYYLPNPVDATSEIFLKFIPPFHSHEHWSSSRSCFSWIDHVVLLPLSFVPTN